MSIPNPKCTSCKCFWKPDETDIKSSGLIYKTCKRCREKVKERRNKEEYKEKSKQYKEENQEKINEYQKQYREENQEKIKEISKQYYQENQDKIIELNKNYRQNNKQKINEYKKQYYQENQNKINEQQKQYREENKQKINEYHKQYREENQDKIIIKSKQYYEKNQDKIKQYREENQDKIKEQKKQYYQENKQKINEYKKQYLKDIKQNNIPLYLCIIQRQQLSRVLKNSNQSKKGHSIYYLGCDTEYFKNYLQYKIDSYNQNDLNEIKMDFQNIHIDHIKPINKFNLDDDDDFNSCCHYSNLQPLLIKDNLSKNAKWSDEDNKYWLENIKGKEHLEIYIPS
jgi:DNA repair exonuclease SbcCD ATPase subunit